MRSQTCNSFHQRILGSSATLADVPGMRLGTGGISEPSPNLTLPHPTWKKLERDDSGPANQAE